MFELPARLPSELGPLSWLVGVWEGSGVLDYQVGDQSITREFGQRLSFSHDLPHQLQLVHLARAGPAPTTSRLRRSPRPILAPAPQPGAGDPGPASCPAHDRAFAIYEEVEHFVMPTAVSTSK
jgi:hypothetical protein